jgi:hypothetical protein
LNREAGEVSGEIFGRKSWTGDGLALNREGKETKPEGRERCLGRGIVNLTVEKEKSFFKTVGVETK